MSNAYIKIEHWTFFARQNRKRKNNGNLYGQVNSFWFEFCLWIGVFCTRGRHPSKRVPPNNTEFTILKRKQNSYVNNPTGFQLCYRLYVFKRLITLLLSCRWSWLIDAEIWARWLMPNSGCKVIQWDIVLRFIPNFCLDRPFGFSFHRDTHFCPSRLFRFSTCRVYRFFFISSLIFSRTLLVRREALIFA